MVQRSDNAICELGIMTGFTSVVISDTELVRHTRFAEGLYHLEVVQEKEVIVTDLQE